MLKSSRANSMPNWVNMWCVHKIMVEIRFRYSSRLYVYFCCCCVDNGLARSFVHTFMGTTIILHWPDVDLGTSQG